MTHKEVFRKVKRHLLKQNRKCVVTKDMSTIKDAYDDALDIGDCLFYGPNKMRCAVGCLIEKDEYNLQMENMSLSHILSTYQFRNFGYEHKDLLAELQNIHDASSPDKWPALLDEIEKEKSYLLRRRVPS